MRIQYASDLHLEFPDNRAWLKQNPVPAKGDILILAGDILNLGKKMEEWPWFDQWSEAYEQVFLIPGNHEYYEGYDVGANQKTSKVSIRHTNQLGYTWLREHLSFDPEAVFEI